MPPLPIPRAAKVAVSRLFSALLAWVATKRSRLKPSRSTQNRRLWRRIDRALALPDRE